MSYTRVNALLLTFREIGHQQQLMTVVREFANQGVAVVLVAHDVNLASNIADRFLGLHNGNMIAQGKAEDVINPEVLKQLYGIDVTVIPHPKQAGLLLFNDQVQQPLACFLSLSR